MFEKKDFTKLNLEELILEETKVKKSTKLFYVIAGVAVGITLYAIYNQSVGFIHFALPMGSAYLINKGNEDLKAIKEEINLRE